MRCCWIRSYRGMDGIETLRQIRKRRPAARVMMITAFGTIELAVEAMKLGATDFCGSRSRRRPCGARLPPVLSKAPPRANRSRHYAAPRCPETPASSALDGERLLHPRLTRTPGCSCGRTSVRGSTRHRGPEGEVIVTIDQKEAQRSPGSRSDDCW